MVKRKTKEGEVIVKLEIGESDKSSTDPKINFFGYMLELFSKHGRFELEVMGKGG